ncbi:MAG: hypothetical protein VW683_16485 [Betaproteobacteria bacterium]
MARPNKSSPPKESRRGIRGTRSPNNGFKALARNRRSATGTPTIKITPDVYINGSYGVSVAYENGLCGYTMFSAESPPTKRHPKIQAFLKQLENQ